jgi:hypothetical protein
MWKTLRALLDILNCMSGELELLKKEAENGADEQNNKGYQRTIPERQSD